MNIRPHLPSLFSCLKAPVTKDTESTKKEEGRSDSPAPALSSNKKRGKYSSLLQKVFRQKHPSEKPAPQWEPNSLLIDPELGDCLLQQLVLDKADIASGIFGSISIFKNENNDKFVGKISKTKSSEDYLSVELDAYQSIYRDAGHHLNLVNVYGIAKMPDRKGRLKRTLLMDLVPGPSGSKTFAALRECWNTGKISSNEYWGAIQFLGRRLLDVTEHMSKADVVHNDIKPENFLVNEMTGEPVLIDLGLSSKKDACVKQGTLGFLSPEADPEFERGIGVDVRSDVFTVGATLLKGIEGVQLPNKGLLRTNDASKGIKRQPGTYSATTAYTHFMEFVLQENQELRFFPEQAKDLEFLNDSMLDDNAAKEVIKKTILLAGIEEKKPVEEQWKRAEPEYNLYNARDEKTNAVLESPAKSGVDSYGIRLQREDKEFVFSSRGPVRALELQTHLKHQLKQHQEHQRNSWHMKYPLVGLNAKFFEESILNSIQMGASDNRSWGARTEDMGKALDKLKILEREQITPLSSDKKAALGKIFHTIVTDVRVQQSRIEEILSEKNSISPESEIHDTGLEEVAWAKKVLDAVGRQVERLAKYVEEV